MTKPAEPYNCILGKTSLEAVMLGISKFDTSKVLFKLTDESVIEKLKKRVVNIKDDAVNIKLPHIKTEHLQKFGIYKLEHVVLVQNTYKGVDYIGLVCIDQAPHMTGFEVREPQEYTEEMLEEVNEI